MQNLRVNGSLAVVALAASIALQLLGCGYSEEEMQAKRNRIAELEGSLGKSRERNSTLEARLKELGDRNSTLQARLSAAGIEMGELENQQAQLTTSLAEKERALAELRERERQAQARLETFQRMVAQFKSMIDSGKLRVRIVRGRMVVELAENILFDSGKAKLKDEGQAALTEVAAVLASIGQRDFQIAGHTDNIPIRSRRFPSNWELSTARAVEVTRYLAEHGVDPARLSAAGYADTQPVASNADPEGRRQNRRIEIVLQPNLEELPDLSGLVQG